MKKEKLLIILGAAMVGLMSVALVLVNKDKITKENDALKFKEEYESLNGVIRENGAAHRTLSIDEKNPMKYSSFEEIKDVLQNGTGVIYFGFPECPWCRAALPVILESAKEVGVDKIYYLNALDSCDKKSLDQEGNLITEKEGTKEYYELVEIMKDHLGEYTGLEDPTIKRLYFPTVVFVKDGKILGLHVSTVDSQIDPRNDLTNEQKNELKNIYITYMSQVLGITCPATGEAC